MSNDMGPLEAAYEVGYDLGYAEGAAKGIKTGRLQALKEFDESFLPYPPNESNCPDNYNEIRGE